VVRPPEQKEFTELVIRELQQRSDYLTDKQIDTIYLGGGTPSLMEPAHIRSILDSIHLRFEVHPDTEITLEANPDDINAEQALMLREAGINRISLGIQSLFDEHLRLMNRRHSAGQALDATLTLKSAGFDRISLDLIYGIPGLTEEQWISTLERITELPANHLSAYHLTFEPGTRFSVWKKKGIINEIPDEESLNQYRILREMLIGRGFRHYEISNFARGGELSRHNSKYWKNTPYLGIGPSAHSFNGDERHWNPSSLKGWTHQILNGSPPEGEKLDPVMKRNEFVMTRLRTDDGIDTEEFMQLFGARELEKLLNAAKPSLSRGDLLQEAGIIRFNPDSWFRSDGVMASLFAG